MSNRDQNANESEKLTYHGRRGPEFRTFKRDFMAIARGRFSKDDRFSFHAVFHRRDEGGTANGAPPMPAQQGGQGGGVNAAFTQATVKKAVRNGEAYRMLYQTMEDDSIKEMLFALAEQDPAELAADAWALVEAQCGEPSDDLELSKSNLLWEKTNIMNSVGHKLETITDFARELTNINTRRPANERFDENAQAVKFLSCIVFPDSLAKDAADELRRVPAERRWQRNAQHDRHFNNIVTYFDNMWASSCGATALLRGTLVDSST